jgi:hypothetical protein
MIVQIFFLIIAITFVYADFSSAPWVPTKRGDIERFLKLAALHPGQTCYDLGAGDGRLLIAAASKGATAKGFEISLFPYALAQLRIFLSRSSATISYRNFWHHHFHDADVIYLFLSPKSYQQLKDKFIHELKPGTKVIAYVWPIEGWQPTAVDQVAGKHTLYLYQV